MFMKRSQGAQLLTCLLMLQSAKKAQQGDKQCHGHRGWDRLAQRLRPYKDTQAVNITQSELVAAIHTAIADHGPAVPADI
jgi:hypothetical protein